MLEERKLAVVTGGSSGIGFELARQFAQNGFDVVIAADSPEVEEAARMLAADSGSDVHPVLVDLAQAEGVEELYRKVLALGRPVDALALNAGVGVSGAFVQDIPLDDDLNLIRLNVISSVHLAKLILPWMVARKKGWVLVTSSIAALMPGPFYATYAASKAFLLSFAEALHNELQGHGITVMALMPGATDTRFFERAGMQDTKVATQEKDDPALVAREAFEGLMAGKDHLIAGSMKNKVSGFMTRFLSQQQLAELQRAQTEPGSAA